MRKIAFLSLLIIATTTVRAQDYLISFAGAGASVSVDSVQVENLTQGTRLNVEGGNQLQLLGTLSSVDPLTIIAGRSLLAYPNPAQGDVTLSFEATANAGVTLDLSDMMGRQVAKTQAFLTKGRHSFRIIGLKSGTYLVQVHSESYRYCEKIICRLTSPDPTQIVYVAPCHGNTETGSLKQTEAVVLMQYNTGDLLKFTGRSGIYGTVYMDVPASGKTITFNFIPCTDLDSNNYTIVQVHDQWWMAENLKTTKYSNGEDIPEVTGQSNWMGLTTGAFCYFGNDPDNSLVFGCLYNWYAAKDTRNPCPANWHVPSDAEWIVLTSFLGGEEVAGGKMKEPGTEHWFSPNTGATDESGLAIIAGGNRTYGNFDSMGYGGSFWSTTTIDPIFAWNRDIFYYNTVANRHGTDKKSGLSLRCVKN